MQRSIIVALTFVALLAPTGYAQKKRTPTRKTQPAKTQPQPVADTRAEATLAAEQLKVLSRFLYTYGKIANGLEVADDQAKRTRLSPEITEKNRQIKANVVNSIAGLKGGIDKLDAALRNNPKLQVQYVNLFGVSEAILKARDLAANNQFDEAGRSLITATEKLSDLLLAIR